MGHLDVRQPYRPGPVFAWQLVPTPHRGGEWSRANEVRQRMSTGKLLPGEVPLRGDENAEKVISTGKSRIEKIDVRYFYDLSATGKYTVYVDVKDPLSGKWLRSDTVNFEIRPPDQ